MSPNRGFVRFGLSTSGDKSGFKVYMNTHPHSLSLTHTHTHMHTHWVSKLYGDIP